MKQYKLLSLTTYLFVILIIIFSPFGPLYFKKEVISATSQSLQVGEVVVTNFRDELSFKNKDSFFLSLFLSSFFEEPPPLHPSSMRRGLRGGAKEGEREGPTLKLNLGQKEKTYLSPIIKADFPFNALGIIWKGKNPLETNIDFYLKTSVDRNDWSDWVATEQDYQKNDRPDFANLKDNRYSSELIPAEGLYLQYKIILSRVSLEINPEVQEVRLVYINSKNQSSLLISPSKQGEQWHHPLIPSSERRGETEVRTIPSSLRRGGGGGEGGEKEGSSPVQREGVSFSASIDFIADQDTTSSYPIITRQQWGVDESYRFCYAWDKIKNICSQINWALEKWPRSYVPLEKVVLHHTAGPQKAEDITSLVKAIYWWHAIARNWGDIGYNYLIDSEGNIYEGRSGGDGVVAGHTYGYNEGTVGIALIGTYGGWIDERYPGEYQTKHPSETILEEREQRKITTKGLETYWQAYVANQITPLAKQALVNLISQKAIGFEWFPLGQSDFKDKVGLPQIVGHRDLSKTTCPGDHFYNELTALRESAQNEFLAKGGLNSIRRQALLVTENNPHLYLKKGEEKIIGLEFKNTGNTTWHHYGSPSIYLAPDTIKTQLSQLDSFRLAQKGTRSDEGVPSDFKVALEDDGKSEMAPPPPLTQTELEIRIISLSSNTQPGEMARFEIKLKAQNGILEETKRYVLVWGQKGWFPQTDYAITIHTTDLEYAAQLISHNLTPAVFENSKLNLNFQFQNIGLKPWLKEKIRLKIEGEPLIKENIIVLPEEREIPPGQIAAFNFNLMTKDPGLYNLHFTLERTDKETSDKEKEIKAPNPSPAKSEWLAIAGGKLTRIIRVDSPLKAEIVSLNIPPAVLTTWRPTVLLTFKNSGAITWNKNLVLKSKRELFYYKTWKTKTIIEKLDKEIPPGQIVSFLFQLSPPQTPGPYEQVFTLELGSKKLYINNKKELRVLIRVDTPIKK